MSDPDRTQVYLCDDRLAALVAQGAPVRSGATVLTPEPDHIFANLAEVSLFCTLTCLELALPPVHVRVRRGERQSHYSPAGSLGTPEIALASWGSSRLVVVHELAHHVVQQRHPDAVSHGVEFRAALVDLLRHLALPGQASALEHCYRSVGLTLRAAA